MNIPTGRSLFGSFPVSDPMEIDVDKPPGKRRPADLSEIEAKTQEASGALPFRQRKRQNSGSNSSSSSVALSTESTSGFSDRKPPILSLISGVSSLSEFPNQAGAGAQSSAMKTQRASLFSFQQKDRQDFDGSSSSATLLSESNSGFSDPNPAFLSLMSETNPFSGWPRQSDAVAQYSFSVPPPSSDFLVKPQFWEPLPERRNGREVIVKLNRPSPKTPPDLHGHYVNLETLPPFVQNGIEISKQIEQFLNGTRKESLKLRISSDEELEVIDVKKLGAGDYSYAYKCKLANGETRVLKVYQLFSEGLVETDCEIDGKRVKSEQFFQPAARNASRYMANQLQLYTQIKDHPILKNHVVPFYNFEPHLKTVSPYLKIEDPKLQLEAFQDYVETNLKSGFALTQYLEDEFPSAANFSVANPSPAWVDVKQLLEANIAAGYNNDLSRSNIRCLNGVPLLIDLLEEGEDEKLLYVFDKLVETLATEEGVDEKGQPVKYIYQDVIGWFNQIKPETR